MSNQVRMVVSRTYRHIAKIDLEGNGTLTECAIMKKDRLGNVYFFRIDNIDSTDLSRVFKIITNRNAEHFELWDLMSQTTLGNGVNALEYFHQLVKVITPTGQVFRPQEGRTGSVGLDQPRPTQPAVQSTSGEASAPAPAPAPAAAPPRPAAKRPASRSKSTAKKK